MVTRRLPNEFSRPILTTFTAMVVGYVIGTYVTFLILVSKFNTSKYIPMAYLPSEPNDQSHMVHDSKMPFWVQTNPRGAESLPSGIIASQSDFYLRRLWGHPDEDVIRKPKYLVTFTVGIDMKDNIDAAVKKFPSDDFSIMLFHYDGKTSEWDQFEWSKRAIHFSVLKQTKWWFAKRFLHPDIVATYDYIFVWDEDLGVEHFDPVKYIDLVKKYGLEISQPGLDPSSRRSWPLTMKRNDSEVHKDSTEKIDWCKDPNAPECIYFSKLSILFRDNLKREGSCIDPSLPPCASFVEIMAPVFSRNAWRCVWHMIQNDLVHGWGLDFALQKCVQPAHEKIGVVDAQWIFHKSVPSLYQQGESSRGDSPRTGVRKRCIKEWKMFVARLIEAEKAQQKNNENSTRLDNNLEIEATNTSLGLAIATQSKFYA